MKRASLIIMALGLSACVTPAKEYQVRNERQFDASKEVIWNRLIRHFATNNIQIKTLEKASGVIYAERDVGGAATAWWERGQIGDLADCGKDFMRIPLAHSILLNVLVAETSSKKTTATVTVTFKEIYDQRAGLGGPPATCNSTGRLEETILSSLAKD